MSRTVRQSSGVIVRSVASRVMPALFTRTSTGPSARSMPATPSSQAAKSRTSHLWTVMPVAARKRSAAASSAW